MDYSKAVKIIDNEYTVAEPYVRAAKKLHKLGFISGDIGQLSVEDGKRIPVCTALSDIEIKKRDAETKKSKPKGKKGRAKKFNEQKQKDIRESYHDTKMNIAQIARLYRTSDSTISKIIDRKY